MADNLIGVRVGKYEIIEQLGRGGMAEVYKAYQENLDRHVAIKVMHAFLAEQQDFLARFQREAKAMAALSHPNIVGVYDFDLYKEDTYYLVMEYISGKTLKEKLQELEAAGQRMPLEEALRIIVQIGEALDYAHRRQMIHRDIKPANIMIDDDGKAILTDFGIVKLLGANVMDYTATGALVGTPSYMSPEQALGKPGDERCDIYSLGVMLFQMTTGILPFSADTPLAVVMKHVNDPVPIPVTFNEEVPQALQDVILKSLEKNPEYRYPSARAMVDALRSVNLSDEPATVAGGVAVAGASATAMSSTQVGRVENTVEGAAASPAQTAVIPPVEKKKKPIWALVAAAVLLIVVLGAIGALATGVGRQPAPTATRVAVVVEEPTDTAVPPTKTERPTQTAVPEDTPDMVATNVAAVNQTIEAQTTATGTAAPTPSQTPTASATPNATATFLASCIDDADLIDTYPYTNPRLENVPVGANFPVHWLLENSGTCDWPEGLSFVYLEGEDFGYDDDPVMIDGVIAPGEQITLTRRLDAPTARGRHSSTWQLVTADGEPFAEPLTFELGTYIPVTPTPEATPTPAVSPTPVVIQELDWSFVVGACEDAGSDWRCQVTITPYGGGGGPYTIWVFDQPGGLATEFRGTGSFTYFAKARRCAAFNTEVKVQDDATGDSFSRQLYIDPSLYYACVPV